MGWGEVKEKGARVKGVVKRKGEGLGEDGGGGRNICLHCVKVL